MFPSGISQESCICTALTQVLQSPVAKAILQYALKICRLDLDADVPAHAGGLLLNYPKVPFKLSLIFNQDSQREFDSAVK